MKSPGGGVYCAIRIDSFCDAVKKLSEDKEFYSKVVEDGKNNVKRYSPENIKKQIRDLLDKEKD